MRAPVEHVDLYTRRATELGLSLSSFMVLVMAEKHGLPVPLFVTDELELAKATREQQRVASERAQPALMAS